MIKLYKKLIMPPLWLVLASFLAAILSILVLAVPLEDNGSLWDFSPILSKTIVGNRAPLDEQTIQKLETDPSVTSWVQEGPDAYGMYTVTVVGSSPWDHNVKLVAQDLAFFNEDFEIDLSRIDRAIEEKPIRMTLFWSITQVVLLIVGIPLYRKQKLQENASKHSRWFLQSLLAIPLTVLAIFSLAWALEQVGLTTKEQFWVGPFLKSSSGRVMLLFVAGVMAPVAEEIFFRGYVYNHYREFSNKWIGAILSAGLFTVIHFNPSAIILYFSLGLILAWLYQRTGRILACILLHAGYNVSVLLWAM